MAIASDVFKTQPVSDYKKDVQSTLKTGDLMLCSGTAFFFQPGGILVARHDEFGNKVSATQLKTFSQYAVSKLGYRYNTEDIAKIAARIAVGKVGVKLPSIQLRPQDTAFICSEYVFECYKSLGINLAWDAEGFIAPADIAGDPRVKLLAVLKK